MVDGLPSCRPGWGGGPSIPPPAVAVAGGVVVLIGDGEVGGALVGCKTQDGNARGHQRTKGFVKKADFC